MKVVLAATLFSVVLSQQRVSMEPDVRVHDSRVSSWIRGEQPPADHTVALTVVVRIDDDRRAELERVFWEVSDPKNANYGKYQSLEEITELLAVPLNRVERVQDYFVGHGINLTVSPNRDMMSLSGPVLAVEAALATKLHFFTHTERGSVQIVRASQGYSLPVELSRDVVMVGDLLQFPHIQPQLPSDLGGVAEDSFDYGWPNTCCGDLVSPGILSDRYRYPNATADDETVTGNSMAVAEFGDQYSSTADLTAFQSKCSVPTIAVDTFIGAYEDKTVGVEAALDIQYILAVAPSVPLTLMHTPQYSLLDWANQITSMADPPLVHSVSYGNDETQQAGVGFMFSVNTAFMKAGVQGMSILFASGDEGVCGRENCGVDSFFPHIIQFLPWFPASSPYITAVGGTDFLARNVVGDEQVWPRGGGGFSNIFDIPAYQQEAVAGYKARSDANLPDRSLWNATGRGFPDISALGGQKNKYCIVADGEIETVCGTSASTPVVAGIFARLNGLRLAAGKPALGFLNPFLYQNPSAFFDVKVGVNDGNPASADFGGFTATEGWDAATGLGTPNYDSLVTAVMASVQEAAV